MHDFPAKPVKPPDIYYKDDPATSTYVDEGNNLPRLQRNKTRYHLATLRANVQLWDDALEIFV